MKIVVGLAIGTLVLAGCGRSSLVGAGPGGPIGPTVQATGPCDPKMPFGGGDGSAGNPFQLSLPCHFENLSAPDTNLAANYIMVQDIDLSGSAVTASVDLVGTFDGKSHKISNWKTGAPLFETNWGTIQNVILTNIQMDRQLGSTGGRVGLLVGTNETGGKIINCSVTGSLSNAYYYAGGLVGLNQGSIQHSSANGTFSGSNGTGGLVGYNNGSILASFSLGSVIAVGAAAVGGLVGQNTGTVQNSYSLASASGVSQVGGLVGYNTGTVLNSYSSGAASGTSTVGGLVGEVSGGSVTSSYWDQTVSGNANSAAGTGETTAQMQQAATFAGWDFSIVWIAPLAAYPTLW